MCSIVELFCQFLSLGSPVAWLVKLIVRECPHSYTIDELPEDVESDEVGDALCPGCFDDQCIGGAKAWYLSQKGMSG